MNDIEAYVDPIDELLDRAEDLDSEVLASRILEACRGNGDQLIEYAFHVARALPDEHRARLLDRLSLSREHRARVDRMLGQDGDKPGNHEQAAHPAGVHAIQTTKDLHGVDKQRPSEGTLIDQRYELMHRLGRGGMGEVYLARDRKLKREVAVKLLTRIGDADSVARFLREARVTAQCRHENIVTIYDVGEHRPGPEPSPGYPYMVLEYLEGRTLREYLREQWSEEDHELLARESTGRAQPRVRAKGLVPSRALDLIIPVVRALAYAHERAIVHRDLKPENIFITKEAVIVVLDFGIAKPLLWAIEHASTLGSSLTFTNDSVNELQTREGVVIGTLQYMAPEQWGALAPEERGEGALAGAPRTTSVDHRTDLWAVGIILYEMLAGGHPVPARSLQTLHAEICNLEQPMPRLVDALDGADPCLAAPSLLAIVDRCLMKRKHERMATTAELLAALEAARAELTSDPALAAREPAQRQPRAPLPRWIWLATGLVLAGSTALLLARSPERVPTIAHFPEDVAGIVVASSSAEATATYDGLCAALEQDAPLNGLRCIQEPWLDDDTLRRKAAEAGATLIVRIDTAREARLLPLVEAGSLVLNRPIARPIAEQPPMVRVATPGAQVQVAKLSLALSQLFFPAARSPMRGTGGLPEPSVAEIGWRGATLVWVLRIANNDYAETSIPEARAVVQACAESVSVADWYCAAAHYAYTVYCDDCSDTGPVLERLALDGHETFRRVARLTRARFTCEQGSDPDAATVALFELDRQWGGTDCRRWTLVDAASCVLLSSAAPASAVRDLAFPERAVPTLESCDNHDVIATALAARGRWHYHKADLAQAELDFAKAWEFDARNPAYPVRWAEAFMSRRGLQLNDPEKRRLREQLVPFPDARPTDRVLIAFLRWIGLRDEGAASELDQMFSALPDDASALKPEHDPDGSLRWMACTRSSSGGEAIDPIACEVYGLLSATKTPDSRARLRAHLFARR